MTAPTRPAEGLSAGQIAAIIALLEAQAAARKKLSDTAVAAALAPFKAFTGWWDAGRVNRAIDEVLRVIQPAQRQAARSTDAYVARIGTIMTGRHVEPAGSVDVTRLRRAMSDQVTRELVDGTRREPYVILGEQGDDGRAIPAATIDDPAPTVIPDPGRTNQVGRTASRAGETVRSEPVSLARTSTRQRSASRRVEPTPAAPAAMPTRADTRQRSATTSRLAEALRREAVRRATAPVAEVPRQQQRQAEPAAVVDPAEPYGRIADQYRYQVVGEAIPEDKARERALVRIAAVAHTDITLAVREQYRRSIGKIPGITGWRRILRPELSDTGPCGLCVVAADRIYHIQDLKPIHDNCVCEVLPIIGAMDPGLFLNDSDLEAIYGAAGGTGGDVIKGGRRHSGRLKNLRVALTEHGEIGPILVDADQHYRGPRDVARTQHPDRRVRDRARLEAFEDRLAVTLRRQARGEDVERALQWQAERVEKLRRELAGAGVAA